MILSGKEILKHMGKEIIITPFDEKRINPNSYNLSLADELLVYEQDELDMKKPNPTKRIVIPEEGLLLEPNRLYLGRTNEFTRTDRYVPMLEGRSSTGRLGLFIHVTAGFGDIGLPGTGRWRFSVCSRSEYIRMWRSARSITTILMGNTISTAVESIRITAGFRPVSCIRTLSESGLRIRERYKR